MQLKIRRGQKEGGLVGKQVIFFIDARASLTRAEADDIRRYKLGNQVLYSNERHSALAENLRTPMSLPSGGVATTVLGGAASAMLQPYKMIGAAVLDRLNLSITVNSLEKGHHIECKGLDELLGTENAIRTACENLSLYLETAATFDGRELVVDFSNGEATMAALPAPAPALAAYDNPASAVAAPPAVQSDYRPVDTSPDRSAASPSIDEKIAKTAMKVFVAVTAIVLAFVVFRSCVGG